MTQTNNKKITDKNFVLANEDLLMKFIDLCWFQWLELIEN
jgi:hypothetical protein